MPRGAKASDASHRALGTFLHELEHSMTAHRDDPRWLTEAVAELVPSWPGVAAEHAAAMQVQLPADRFDYSSEYDEWAGTLHSVLYAYGHESWEPKSAPGVMRTLRTGSGPITGVLADCLRASGIPGLKLVAADEPRTRRRNATRTHRYARAMTWTRRAARIICLGLASISCFAGTAAAGPASILPSSLVTRMIGTRAIAVDVAFRADRPCSLLSLATTTSQRIAVSCDRSFRTRSMLDVAAHEEYPEAMDVVEERAYVVGWTRARGGTVDSPLLVRTDAALIPDQAFGSAGRATIQGLRPGGATEAWLMDVEVAGDGSVFVAGTTKSGDRSTTRQRAFIAKVTPAGALDTSFADGGVRIIPTPSVPIAESSSLRLLADGSLLLVGGVDPRNGPRRGLAALVDASGALLQSFGGDGVVEYRLAPGASSFFQLPRSGSTLPMVVSASGNDGRGKVRPFLAMLRADGSLQPNWGGYSSHRVTTMTGQPDWLQGMDVEVAPNGAIYAAAETTQLGDWDPFVSRFNASNGRPDTRWAVGGFEPIDANTNHSGSDNEYVMAMTVSPGGAPWAVGGYTRGRLTGMLAFRTIARGTALQTRSGGIVALDSNNQAMRCGSTRARACIVRRGTALRVGMVYPGVNPPGALLQPILRSWRQTSAGWRYAERSARPRAVRGRSISTFALRLAVGVHELEGWRNGSATLGHGRTNTLYVRVRS